MNAIFVGLVCMMGMCSYLFSFLVEIVDSKLTHTAGW